MDTADLFFDQFDIESHVVSLFATYGITDRWDVNILLPIIHTSLEVDARAVLNNESGTGTHMFDGRWNGGAALHRRQLRPGSGTCSYGPSITS